ncbi:MULTISPECIES: hypothetical protein [Bradyrhizobium]|jgi:hypothetical protein|uniref:hypothetical protein n=1 Tax=Bradyrhizobium TaxID=374 RepID=UPI00047F5E4C|nr:MULTISPECIES: hypothetical protein [Bradyrhizobium]MCS3452018.1 hypothetical protein [Bradyrhizobium elkanii]MCS3565883.1 hypothetical protein [Bradyrhizobium elkanii]MCW2153387.1 hypothetical protein [Bradyrhizobium elkanii]MCW2356927.1 hypothetical protein [Bradyrhizobium elkanii]MCW2377120.1 hypothetical protein [Bradyrhizobium elkanii]
MKRKAGDEFQAESEQKGEISFDLVMEEDMPFVEGCYRLSDGNWHVFMVRHSRGGTEQVGIYRDLAWKSGVTGVNVIVRDEKINKSTVLRLLSDALEVTEWLEVQGPDSMQLR